MSDMVATRKVFVGMGSALLLAATNLTIPTGSSHADELLLHRVKYTLTAKHPVYANIYYLDQEPATFSDYSHNSYQFVPNIHVDIAPAQPWSYELDLANPEQWALVSANTGAEPGEPQFHCDLAVDGVVVASKDSPKGVLCSLRSW